MQTIPRSLNVGCGYDKREGFLNIDMDPACSPDLLIENNDMSVLPKNHFHHLIAYDVIEHIHRSETTSTLLEWSSLMTMGATIEVETSNVLAIVDMMRANETYANQAACTIFMYGNQVHGGDYHLTGFTEITLRVHLATAGFEIDELIHHLQWIILVKGHKTMAWDALLTDGEALSNEDFVKEAYHQALNRQPEEPFLSLEIDWLNSGEKTRREVLKKLFNSDERRLQIAGKLGY